jgi:hypothetical protein
MFRRVMVVLVSAGSLVACGSKASEAEDLCRDLGNLNRTVAFLVAPPSAASVGEVRGGLDKLDPTFSAIAGSDAVPEADTDALLEARDDYLEALEGIGDDDRFGALVVTTAGAAQRLAGAFEAVERHLACAGRGEASPTD